LAGKDCHRLLYRPPKEHQKTYVYGVCTWLVTVFLFITSAKEGGYVFGSVCLSVCLFVFDAVGWAAGRAFDL